jgi:hypothetical protein
VRSRESKLWWSEVTSKRWRGLVVRKRGFRRKDGRRIDKNSSKASVWRAELETLNKREWAVWEGEKLTEVALENVACQRCQRCQHRKRL